MESLHIPKFIQELLEKREVSPEEVLCAARCDLNEAFEFQPFYLALTKASLFFFVGEKQPEQRYAGNSKTWSFTVKETYNWLVTDITEPMVERQVVGGVLVITAAGVQRRLCGFTNAYTAEVDRLLKVLGKLQKSEEIKPEDLHDDRPELFCPRCGLPYPDRDRRVCPKCMDKRSIFMRVLGYFTAYKKTIVAILVLVLLNAAVGVVAPLLSGQVFYDGVLAKDPALAARLGLTGANFVPVLLYIVALMIFVNIVQRVFGLFQGRLVAGFVPQAVLKLKSEIFAAMQKLSVSFFAKRQTGSLLTRVLGDSNEVLYFFVDGLPFLLVNVLMFIASAVIMLLLNWQMALLVIVFAVGLFFFNYRMMPVIWNLYGKFSRYRRQMGGHINDNLTGARVVRAFGQEQAEIGRFQGLNKRTQSAEMSLNLYDVRFTITQLLFSSVGYSLIWALGGIVLLRNSTFSFGMFMTFIGYLSMLNGPIQFMSFIFRWWSFSMNCAQRIFEIVDAVPEVLEKPDAKYLPEIRGEITLEHVTFAYEPNKNVLHDISLSVKPGEMLGIVGHSGAGKSTLVNLISRLYDPTAGKITLDGENLRDLTFSTLRGNIAMVSQESYIFTGTVAENISYARPEASREAIVAAARAASAHEYITKLPDGYDTLVGAGGRTLSGGERQRLSIARAILANPRILILDEATASVDTETERSIQAALDKLVKGRTTLSIAHRLSTLRSADRLVVIEGGKIVEEGTHLELVKQKGAYYKLMQLQSKALAMRGVNE